MRIEIKKPILNFMTIPEVMKIIDGLIYKLHCLQREVRKNRGYNLNLQQRIIEYDYPIFINKDYFQLNDYTESTLENLREQLKYAYEARDVKYLSDEEPFIFGGF